MVSRKRSQSRMLALQALCLFEALGERFDEQLDTFLRDSHSLHDLGLSQPVDPEIIRYARRLAANAWQTRASADKLLGAISAGWSLARMSRVDRNILRLGAYELREESDVPAQVIINEAIELARMFGDNNSPAFVNGVLDALRKQLGIEADTKKD